MSIQTGDVVRYTRRDAGYGSVCKVLAVTETTCDLETRVFSVHPEDATVVWRAVPLVHVEFLSGGAHDA